MSQLLEVNNLSVSFFTPEGEVQAVRNVSFSLKAGEVLAIVGESGCGKSVMCKSIMKLLPAAAKIKSGSIRVNGIDITEYKERDMTKLRGKLFSMVFQDPMTSLDPTMTIGEQIAEAVRIHYPKLSKEEVKDRVLELMTLVGIDHPKERMKLYPYNFSGGMRQRSVMAIALAANPGILFADEPTTALDVTIQAQILDLIKDIQKQYDTSVIMITHDLGVVANIADDIAVMYAGKIMEYGSAEDIFEHPSHPYTWGVLQSIPPEDTSNREPLHPILGTPPDLFNPPVGCPFAARCPYAMKICSSMYPPAYSQQGEDHYASCWLYHSKAVRTVNPITEREVVKHE